MKQQQNPVHTFLVEAEELLIKIEDVILDLDDSSPDDEAINQLFRAFHTIKGSGSMFGLDAIADFTHHLETALDLARSGELQVTRELLDLILSSKDHIKELLDAARRGEAVPTGSGKELIQTLQSLCGGKSEAQAMPAKTNQEQAESHSAQNLKTWKVRFKPNPKIMEFGTNPAGLLSEIAELGECTLTTHIEDIPGLDAIQPENCYLWWEATLRTEKTLDAIKDIFIFVEDESEIGIEEVLPPAPVFSSESTEKVVVLAPTPVTEKASKQQAAASKKEKEPGSKKTAAQDSAVRVSSDKLDRLVNLVGELVMNQSRLMQAASRLEAPELNGPVEEIERLVSELRDIVLGIRMMPIGATFNRFKRLVHDLSAELGKEIALITEGAETELDKTVLDQLGDPLVHLIRNSIDHGIESAEERAKKGKSRRGTIRLSAAHAGSNVMVTIQDDGRGLNSEAILKKAVERQIISPDSLLSEKEIFNLIFLPGFSTAQQVTKVSGRGVGMDVVKRQIDALRGSVSITSQPGQGTTIALTLPLTLAIIDGLLVEVGADQFIVPMAVVTENVELHCAERAQKNGRNVIAVRGELIPYIRIRETFCMTGEEQDIEKIVIVRHAEQQVGVVVDRVLGSHQTVIQSLGRFYKDISLIAGATIMGDGRVALILDIAGLIDYIDKSHSISLDTPSHFARKTSTKDVERRM